LRLRFSRSRADMPPVTRPLNALRVSRGGSNIYRV
jgi:hypothetical protein